MCDSFAERLGTVHFLPSGEESIKVCTTDAQEYHMRAKDQFVHEWQDYQGKVQEETDWPAVERFVEFLANSPMADEQQYKASFRKASKDAKIVPSKPVLICAYYRLVATGKVTKSTIFEKYLLKKGIRSNSGVVVITVVTAPGPFSCPHDCHYCPNEPGQPRSYLSTEPAVARANQNKFDAVRQIYDRASTLAKQGHEIDKLEIIVLGGTWSGYPAEYQNDFCRDIFYAANTFNEILAKARLEAELDPADLDDGDMPCVAVQLSRLNSLRRPRRGLVEEQMLNEAADCKVIGLTLETRPDFVNPAEIRRLRHLGCTRVQIGVQHTDDEILKKINRGHGLAESVKAVALLKQHCFKVDIHLMPDLPGSSYQKDVEMFDFVLDTPHLQADHWKIYPCEVTPFSAIEDWYAQGQFTPYTEENAQQLIDLLVHVKAKVHPWIRLNRVIRDIPRESIIAGNSNTNLRQEIFKALAARGEACRCIRCREVRDWPDRAETVLVRREYRSSEGDEVFLTIEGVCDRGFGGGAERRDMNNTSCNIVDNQPLYALLRLRFNDDPKAPVSVFPELADCALIRELHVYGTVAPARVALNDSEAVQHFGFGKRLMAEAERIARERGCRRIAVISGIGVRNYYRKRGYQLEGMFMTKELTVQSDRISRNHWLAIAASAVALGGLFTWMKFRK